MNPVRPFRLERRTIAKKETAAEKKARISDIVLHAFSTASEFKQMYPNGKDGMFANLKDYKSEYKNLMSKQTFAMQTALHKAITDLARSEGTPSACNPAAARRAAIHLDKMNHGV